ncbi:MAG: hypothetical protein IJU05_06040 [Schwartzia sp.]|nr:hypothetical protein [Schwartzia sp. (in: firmicutes)]
MSDEKKQSGGLPGEEEELTPEQREIERMKQVLLNEEPEKMVALLRALDAD